MVGIGVAFGLALTAGFAALSLRRSREAGAGRPVAVRFAALRTPLGRWGRSALAVAIASPGRVLIVGLVLALCGWVAGTRTETISDVRELVPQNLAQVRDLNELQNATGVSGELDVSVQTPDIADPALIRWMGQFKQRVLDANGFDGRFPSCRKAQICPGPALSDFLGPPGERVPRARIRGLLAQLPAYDLRGVLARDPPHREVRHRQHRLRDQGPVARRPAGADRPRQGGDRPARHRQRAAAGRHRAARRPARPGRPVGDRPLRQPLLAHPGRNRRGGAGAARRLPVDGRGRSSRWCRSSSPRDGRR